MRQAFDIFRTEPEGSVVWQGTAATVEEAATQVQRFAVNSPAEYMICNLLSGTRRLVTCYASDVLPRKSNFA